MKSINSDLRELLLQIPYLQYKFNIKFSKINSNIDTNIFPIKMYNKSLLYDSKIVKKTINDPEFTKYILFSIKYGLLITDNITSNVNISINNDPFIKYINDNFINNKIGMTKKKNFSVTGTNFYINIKKYNLLDINDNICILSKNYNILDCVLYYSKISNKENNDNITFIFNKYKIRESILNRTTKYLQNSNVKYYEIPNTNIINNINIDKVFSFIYIDNNIFIPKQENYRSNYVIQTLISNLLLLLPKLLIGGNMCIELFHPSSELVFELIFYLRTCFKNARFLEYNILIYLYNQHLIQFPVLFFESYLGNFDVDMFSNIYKKMNKYDNTEGYNYVFNNEEEYIMMDKIIDIDYIKNKINTDNNLPKKYLQHIIEIDEIYLNMRNLFYSVYKNFMYQTYKKYYKIIRKTSKLYKNKDDLQLISKYIRKSFLESLDLAIKYDIPLNDNIHNLVDLYTTIRNIS